MTLPPPAPRRRPSQPAAPAPGTHPTASRVRLPLAPPPVIDVPATPVRGGSLTPSACVVGLLLTVMAALVTGTPIVSGHWYAPADALAVAVAALLGDLLRRSARGASRRVLASVVAVCAVVLTLFVVGATDSVIIAGRVYLDTSPTARAYHTAAALRADANTLAAADRLVTLPPAQARADVSAYQPAIATAEALNRSLFATTPDPRSFSAAYTGMGNAAYWLSQALTDELDQVTQTGSNATGSLATAQATFVSDLATARRAVTTAAAPFHLGPA